MTWVKRGKVQGQSIVFAEPLALPDGTDVVVHLESPSDVEPSQLTDEPFASLPFFGMGADRKDLEDSTAWVRGERERWQQRATRTD